ncbi:MAG: homocysteine S-methyltransferase family protein [Geminicoccaceae bacterium]
MSYSGLKARLDAGHTVIIDGGTGTELEARGIPMNDAAWCGLVAVEHPSVVEEVHADYIAAGAELVTANTFSSSRLMLDGAGAGGRVREIARAAVEAAKRARDRSGRETVIAGSLSHQIPVIAGTDRATDDAPDGVAMGSAFRELAEALAEAGADMILLEMMYDPERMRFAIEAALSTGLPVWCGLSVRRGGQGELLSFSRSRDIPFQEMVDVLPQGAFDVIGVMHSHVDIIAMALEALRDRGPLMAYPDSGYFEMPSWRFVDICPPEILVDRAREWQQAGAQVLGGCCGLGIDHIRALSAWRDLQAPRP